MIDTSKGRYWDLPWSLVDGCAPCSPGCDHCWAAAMAKRFNPDVTLQLLWIDKETGKPMPPAFNRKIITRPDRLSIPLKRRKPTVYAVWNDWLHESVPYEFIAQMLDMACDVRCEHHTFLFLTKRPQRWEEFNFWYGENWPGDTASCVALDVIGKLPRNIFFGLTVCNQQEANEKIPIFLQVPGKKFLSIEPCLGPVWISGGLITGAGKYVGDAISRIDAVILGGETGPGARPLHPDWVRSVRDQCAAAGVPFFFKRRGEWSPEEPLKYCKLSGKRWSHESVSWARDGSIYNPLNPPPDHFPSVTVYRVGRNAAGRLLDGRTHDELPWVKP